MPLVEIKDFNVLINNKPFFDQQVKNKQEAYKKHIEMSKMIIKQQRIYQIICIVKIIINLLVQTYQNKKNTNIPQQINFSGKLEEHNGATMFFITGKQQKTILSFSLDSLE